MKKFLLMLLLIPSLIHAQTQQVVGPNGIATVGHKNDWKPFVQGNGFAQVTTTYACGNSATGTPSGPCNDGFANRGLGSLELKTTGNVNDWAFYYLYKPDGFGALKDLTSMSFDWYRASVPGWNNTDPVDWLFKTPVFRILLSEDRDGQTYNSELVWEGYYNRSNPTPTNTWVRQDNMQSDNFWYVRQNVDPLGVDFYTQGNRCDSPMSMWQGDVNSSGLGSLLSNCLTGTNLSIVGVGVGVGSAWPYEWEGAVDNVRLGFDGKNYNGKDGLNTNFDFKHNPTVVPEPSTYAMLILGLVGIGFVQRKRIMR